MEWCLYVARAADAEGYTSGILSGSINVHMKIPESQLVS
jgi:hypothetical protein